MLWNHEMKVITCTLKGTDKKKVLHLYSTYSSAGSLLSIWQKINPEPWNQFSITFSCQ